MKNAFLVSILFALCALVFIFGTAQAIPSPLESMTCDGRVIMLPQGTGISTIICEKAKAQSARGLPPKGRGVFPCELDNLKMNIKKPCPTN